MNYTVTSNVKRSTYWVQKHYREGYCLNGLQNNALILKTRQNALSVMRDVAFKFPRNIFFIHELGGYIGSEHK